MLRSIDTQELHTHKSTDTSRYTRVISIPLVTIEAYPAGVDPAKSIGACSPTGSCFPCPSLAIRCRKNTQASSCPRPAAMCKGVRPCKSRIHAETPSTSNRIFKALMLLN